MKNVWWLIPLRYSRLFEDIMNYTWLNPQNVYIKMTAGRDLVEPDDDVVMMLPLKCFVVKSRTWALRFNKDEWYSSLRRVSFKWANSPKAYPRLIQQAKNISNEWRSLSSERKIAEIPRACEQLVSASEVWKFDPCLFNSCAELTCHMP